MIKILNKILWIICTIVGIGAIIQILLLCFRVSNDFRRQFVSPDLVFISACFLVALFIYGLINIVVRKILCIIKKRRYVVYEYILMCGYAITVYTLWMIYGFMVI